MIALIVPFCMFSCQDHQLHRMTAVWLLPIVACEVAASSAGLLLQHLAADQHALAILITGYVLWGISVLPNHFNVAFGLAPIARERSRDF